MKKLLAALICVIGGALILFSGVSSLSDPEVKCGDRVMQQGEHCNHISSRGTSSTKDYGAEKSITRNITVASFLFGPLLMIGGAALAVHQVKLRRNAPPRVPAPAPGSPLHGVAAAASFDGPRPLPQRGEAAAPGHPQDFTRPVELACVLDADAVMKRMRALFVMLGGVVWLIAAVGLGLVFPHTTPAWLGGGIVIAAAVCAAAYQAKRNQLLRHYGQLQRLVLHPGGLRRFDPFVVIDIPWTGITGLTWRNSALPSTSRVHTASALAGATNAAIKQAQTVPAAGIVGQGTIAPLPDAPRRMLQIQDRLYGSDMAGGYPHSGPDCVIFPAEFEVDWASGVVGDWLRHFRPDLNLTAHP